VNRLCELGKPRTDRRLGGLGIAEHESGRAVEVDRVVTHRRERESAAACFRGDRLLVVASGQANRGVQASGYSSDHSLGKQIGESLDESVSTTAIASSHPAQMAVELTGSEKVGERVLSAARRIGRGFPVRAGIFSRGLAGIRGSCRGLPPTSCRICAG
jgi:hypothetical protein